MQRWIESFKRGWNAPPMAYQAPHRPAPDRSPTITDEFQEAEHLMDGFGRHLSKPGFREELQRLIRKYDNRADPR
jgi:hypothetical protein